MSMNEAEVSGATGDVAGALVKATGPLAKIGVDGPARAKELLADRDACEKADAEQEEAKRVVKAKTAAKDELYHRLWVKASGLLDVVIASVQKDSEDAANFRRIRSRVSRPPADEAAPVPLPVPVPGRTQ